jgi:hypothetical protein
VNSKLQAKDIHTPSLIWLMGWPEAVARVVDGAVVTGGAMVVVGA